MIHSSIMRATETALRSSQPLIWEIFEHCVIDASRIIYLLAILLYGQRTDLRGRVIYVADVALTSNWKIMVIPTKRQRRKEGTHGKTKEGNRSKAIWKLVRTPVYARWNLWVVWHNCKDPWWVVQTDISREFLHSFSTKAWRRENIATPEPMAVGRK